MNLSRQDLQHHATCCGVLPLFSNAKSWIVSSFTPQTRPDDGNRYYQPRNYALDFLYNRFDHHEGD